MRSPSEAIPCYLLTAIDLPTRFAFAYTYKSSSSSTARDFLGKLKMVTPFPIMRVQTDNGHEFLKHFAQACQQERLVHFFNYPRHPQSNAHLERFNRTIQEQFAQANTHLLDEPALFNRELMRYLLWYNTERPHRAIGNVPPLRYYRDKFATPNQSNTPWTLTAQCKPKDYQARSPGDMVELDTLDLRPLPGVLLKHFTAHDVVCKWNVLGVYTQASATTAADFLDSLSARMPFPIRLMRHQPLQVDGGSEFESIFEEACQRRGIQLFVLPPRSPKLNGGVERAHRTHTEEFYEVTDSTFALADLRPELLEWETIYNTVRPH